MTPTPITRAMREAAEKATPGPWSEMHNMAGPMGIVGVMPEGFREKVCWLDISAREQENAAHIALAKRANVLALLDALEEAGKALEPFAEAAADDALGAEDTDFVNVSFFAATLRKARNAFLRIHTLSGEEE